MSKSDDRPNFESKKHGDGSNAPKTAGTPGDPSIRLASGTERILAKIAATIKQESKKTEQ